MLDLTNHTTRPWGGFEFELIEKKAAISVVGLGYVGAVSTACLSSLGHRVVGVDIDPVKVEHIAAGTSPIHEDQLGNMLAEGVDQVLVSATTDLVDAVLETDVTFVSVGTPTSEDGGCDYSYIEAAAQAIGEGLLQKTDFHVIVMRCSVPPGTTMKVMARIIEDATGLRVGEDFGLCFNPEFLREGVAVKDFFAPPKTVIGASDDRSARILKKIYEPVDQNIILTSIETAEMVKYVDNVWHATKVCFANEVGRLSKPLGVDSHDVMDIFVQDTKLNLSPYYLKPGFAYGGSCLPKEVRAVAHLGEKYGVSLPLIDSLGTSNSTQIATALEMVRKTGARSVGILGLAFKPGTDDLRESPILEVIAALHAEGVSVRIHDPAITKQTALAGQLSYVQNGTPWIQSLSKVLPDMLCDTVDDVTHASDVLVVTHSNDQYREAVQEQPTTPVIDLVRLFDGKTSSAAYQGIGW